MTDGPLFQNARPGLWRYIGDGRYVFAPTIPHPEMAIRTPVAEVAEALRAGVLHNREEAP